MIFERKTNQANFKRPTLHCPNVSLSDRSQPQTEIPFNLAIQCSFSPETADRFGLTDRNHVIPVVQLSSYADVDYERFPIGFVSIWKNTMKRTLYTASMLLIHALFITLPNNLGCRWRPRPLRNLTHRQYSEEDAVVWCAHKKRKVKTTTHLLGFNAGHPIRTVYYKYIKSVFSVIDTS